MAKKLGALALMGLLKEARVGAGDKRPIAVAGARELVPILARQLREGGDASAVVENRVEGAAAVVWIGRPEKDALRAANKAGIPVIAVSEEDDLPYVLAEDVVHVPGGHGFPVAEIADALARRLDENGTALAARLPLLRRPLCDHMIASAAKKNALISAAVFIPGVDMPILTLNQARLVLRIAIAYGQPVDNQRLPELLGVFGAGIGLRAAARELLDFVPVAGWALKGAVSYAGTRALGQAAVRYFEARA
jgi:uncharacterized protein (DUF697 family)